MMLSISSTSEISLAWYTWHGGGQEELGEERVWMGGGGAPATSSLGATWQAQLGKVGLEGEGDPGEAWRTARQASGQRVRGNTWREGCRGRGAS